MKYIVILFLLYCCQVIADVILVPTLDQADAQTAVDGASNGDIIQLPAGTNGWAVGLDMKGKAITVAGAGLYAPVIINETNSYVTNYNSVGTKIFDGLTDRTKAIMFNVFEQTNLAWCRITGIHFAGGTNSSDNLAGTIKMIGLPNSAWGSTNLPRWRIDHCWMDKIRGRMTFYGAHAGLIDHCFIDQGGQAGTVFQGRRQDEQNSYSSWSSDVIFGTPDEGVYMESNTITNSSHRGGTDGFAGARFVSRYQLYLNSSLENHGTESANYYRGTRWMVGYGDTYWAGVSGEYAIHYRSGTGLITSNRVYGTGYPGLVRLANYRQDASYSPWGMANGASPWDENDTNIYETGTYTGPTGQIGAPQIVTDSSKSWTINQWVGHSVVNMSITNTISGLPMLVIGGQIIANSATALTLENNINIPGGQTWTNGNSFEIRKVIRVIDSCGSGKSSAMTYTSGSTQPTPTTWPANADDPVCVYDNPVHPGSAISLSDYTLWLGRNATNIARSNYVFAAFPHENIALTEGTNSPVVIPNSVTINPRAYYNFRR